MKYPFLRFTATQSGPTKAIVSHKLASNDISEQRSLPAD
jgi:hypothetical protein